MWTFLGSCGACLGPPPVGFRSVQPALASAAKAACETVCYTLDRFIATLLGPMLIRGFCKLLQYCTNAASYTKHLSMSL